VKLRVLEKPVRENPELIRDGRGALKWGMETLASIAAQSACSLSSASAAYSYDIIQ
jgi:hypothetical protein